MHIYMCVYVYACAKQYIQPHDHAVLSQAELVVIDEAAAIPLPIVKAMLGVYICACMYGYGYTCMFVFV